MSQPMPACDRAESGMQLDRRDATSLCGLRHVGDSFAAPVQRAGVLLLGNYRPTLTVARALDRLGYRVVVGRSGGEGGAEFSRSVDEVWDHPPLASGCEADFARALRDFIGRRADIAVVYPIADEFVTCLAQHPQAIPPDVLLASPRRDVVQFCGDKLAMLRRAAALGVPCERFRTAANAAELLAAAAAVGFPVVVRPVSSQRRFGHKKALICIDAAALAKMPPGWPSGHGAVLVQRQARGERHNIFFAAQHGRIVCAVETRILRTDHLDGTGLAVDGETVPLSPELVEDTAKLTASMDYTGVGLTQFIVDRQAGRRCFLELNPRIAGSHAIAEQSGAELSRLAIDLARGAPCAAAPRSYRTGVRYAWTYGDLRGLKSALERREVTAWGAVRWLLRTIATFVRARRHMTWHWADPLPTIMLFLRPLGIGTRGTARPDVLLSSPLSKPVVSIRKRP